LESKKPVGVKSEIANSAFSLRPWPLPPPYLTPPGMLPGYRLQADWPPGSTIDSGSGSGGDGGRNMIRFAAVLRSGLVCGLLLSLLLLRAQAPGAAVAAEPAPTKESPGLRAEEPSEARIAELLKQLSSQSEAERARAEEDLARIGPAAWRLPPELAARLGKLGPSFVDRYREARGRDRGVLLRKLVSRAPREAEPYLILALVGESDRDVIWEALETLGHYRSRAALEAVLKFTRSRERGQRVNAALALAAFPDEEVTKRLVELTSDPEREVRSMAFQSLSYRGRTTRPLATAAVVSGLDEKTYVWEAAAGAAEAIGVREALDKLWPVVEGRSDIGVRWRAILAIGGIVEPGDEAAADRLAKLLTNDGYREHALDALVFMAGRSAAPKVAKLFSGPCAAKAADTLATVGGPEQFPALRKCLKARENPVTAFRAGRALVLLGAPSAAEEIGRAHV
jgi:hypothetical protein